MSSIFSRIIRGEIPCYKIAEAERFMAFLDVNPLAEGHTLVVPKSEIDYIFDIEDDLLGEMIIFSKMIAKGIERTIPCRRIGVTVIGLEVPHAHIHLIPINQVSDMNFARPKLQFNSEKMTEICKAINSNL